MRNLVFTLCLLSLTSPAVADAWRMPSGPWLVPGEVRAPTGPWLVPGEVRAPTGKWQMPQDFRAPNASVATVDACRGRISVVGDALFDFDKASLRPQAETT